MKQLIQRINRVLVLILLTVFYLIGVGVAYILWKFFVIFGGKKKESFWENSPVLRKKDFVSPY